VPSGTESRDSSRTILFHDRTNSLDGFATEHPTTTAHAKQQETRPIEYSLFSTFCSSRSEDKNELLLRTPTTQRTFHSFPNRITISSPDDDDDKSACGEKVSDLMRAFAKLGGGKRNVFPPSTELGEARHRQIKVLRMLAHSTLGPSKWNASQTAEKQQQ